ncbi:hypothetical protein B0A52_05436 [Exophiala mesophila]|uniref:Uncharacterized protein n=1 Tax=Exophiala mesophila TaxID=212818 RepID=A0A438N4W2_EXOME|nr:hypothetical protein B0A52_05436 [Exophiala mesophila]
MVLVATQETRPTVFLSIVGKLEDADYTDESKSSISGENSQFVQTSNALIS